MDTKLWIAVVIVAIATFLMRALPFVWMRRRLDRQGDRASPDAVPMLLVVLGPAMISAMFGVSLAPPANSWGFWLTTLFGVLATLLVWLRTRSLGWPVFAGVAAYGTALYIMS